MHRFSFRSPLKKTKKKNETKVSPSLAIVTLATRGPSLRLFKRRPSRSPSLDELASPDPFLYSESPISSSGREGDSDVDDVDDRNEERAEASDEDDEDDERVRLGQAKARALQMRAAPGGVAASIDSDTLSLIEPRRDGDYGDEHLLDDALDVDIDGEDEEDEDEGTSLELHLPSNVVQLQRQVRALLHARIQAENAWRQENAQLREQLALAEARANTLSRAHVTAGRSPPTAAETATPALPLTRRERELLRLVVRIVGTDQIHALLAAPTPAGAGPTASVELRRRLVARAKTPAPSRTLARPAVQYPTPTPSLLPSQPTVFTSTTTVSTPPALLLCGTRKHEMSAAM